MPILRHAVVRIVRTEHDVPEHEFERIKRFLPYNFKALLVGDGEGHEEIHIVGFDQAGWTLEDYVIPRLASGLIFAEEVRS